MIRVDSESKHMRVDNEEYKFFVFTKSNGRVQFLSFFNTNKECEKFINDSFKFRDWKEPMYISGTCVWAPIPN